MEKLKTKAKELGEILWIALKIAGVIILLLLSIKGYKVLSELFSKSPANDSNIQFGDNKGSVTDNSTTVLETDSKSPKKKYKDKMEDYLSTIEELREKYSD